MTATEDTVVTEITDELVEEVVEESMQESSEAPAEAYVATPEELTQALQEHHFALMQMTQNLEAVRQYTMQMGLYIEWLCQELKLDSDEAMNRCAAFVQARHEEMQAAHEAAMKRAEEAFQAAEQGENVEVSEQQAAIVPEIVLDDAE